MQIAVLGINHKTACVEVREQVALTDEGCRQLVGRLTAMPEVSEAVAVSTCNRTEVYVSGPQLPLRDPAVEGLCEVSTACRADLQDSIYYLEGRAAVEHLFSVVSSLDSMVLGEAQILHQVKHAYQVAEEAGSTGTILNKLLRRSFEVGKRVRSETKIGESSLSIASVSVDLARNVFGDLGGRTVLVIGAGEMAELVVTHLKAHGVSRFRVANRTFERAVELAGRFDGEAVPYEAIEDHLAGVDIVISSTAATEPIIRRKDMERVMRRRKNRPIILIDIAVPRDIDAAVNKVNNAYLYDIDDLQEVVASNLGDRRREAVAAGEIVTEEVDEFQAWLNSLAVVPTLVGFREWATAIKDEELAKFLSKMPDLTDKQRNIVGQLAHTIVNKLVHPPTARIKEMAGDAEALRYAEALQVLYGLETPGAAPVGDGQAVTVAADSRPADPRPADSRPADPPSADAPPSERPSVGGSTVAAEDTSVGTTPDS